MNRCAPCTYEIKVISCLFKPWTTHYKPKSYNAIVTIVCEVTGITELQIKGPARFRDIVEARQLAMYFIRCNNPKMGYKAIGKLFKNGHHTTVIYAINTVAALVKTDPKFRTKYLTIEDIIKRTIRRQIA